jgi:hypothetical protein
MDAQNPFHPVERAILSDYFGVPRPHDLTGITIPRANDSKSVVRINSDPDRGAKDGADEIRSGADDRTEEPASIEETAEVVPASTIPIMVEVDMWGKESKSGLANAVARIALSGVQSNLPQWFASGSDGCTIRGRRRWPPKRDVAMPEPQHLFTIVWALSAPGFSSPERYYCTLIPGFDRYVVTASSDSPDAFGYEDIALGWFNACEPILTGCQHILIEWWRESLSWDGEAWEFFTSAGLVSEEVALRWRAEVWPDNAAEWGEEQLEEEDEEGPDDADE